MTFHQAMPSEAGDRADASQSVVVRFLSDPATLLEKDWRRAPPTRRMRTLAKQWAAIAAPADWFHVENARSTPATDAVAAHIGLNESGD